MSNFHVGQKVVCIDDGMSVSVKHSGLKVGQIYQITGICNRIVPQVTLVEATGKYLANRFRPVVERKTDISVFRAMLNPSKQQVPA